MTGLICRTCNSETGHTWDEALADDLEDLNRLLNTESRFPARLLEDLNRLLNISRERGAVRSKTVRTSDGTPIRILPGNQI